MELKWKLFMLSDDIGAKQKRKSKKRASEINRMVDKHLKRSIPECSQQQKIKTTPPIKKKNQACFNKEKPIPDVRDSVRQHLSKKMTAARGRTAGGPTNRNTSSSFSGKAVQAKPEVRKSKPFLENMSDSHLEKNVSYKTTTSSRHVMQPDRNNDVQLEFKEQGEQVIEMSQEQCNILLQLFENHQDGNEPVPHTDFSVQSDFPAQEILSPVTSTSNMLERLLRRSGSSSPERSLSSGLEESTESMPGLR
jgi:hypothetical protein